jgi:phosphate transport system permease protein
VSIGARQVWRSGEPFIWLTGGALAFALVLVLGLLGLIAANGLGFFWPADVVRLTLSDGTKVTGVLVEREAITDRPGQHRVKLKVANRDLYGADFRWVDEAAIAGREYPRDVVVMERTEWGLLIGTIKEVREGGRVVAVGSGPGLAEVERRLPDAARARREIKAIEKGEVGAINHAQEKIRLRLRSLALAGTSGGPAVEALQSEMAALQTRYQEQAARLTELRGRQTASVVVSADGGKEKDLPLIQLVHVDTPNTMSLVGKGARYLARVWGFVADDPRESNTEGGVFPAIFGTVMMVMIMSLLVTPLGVLAAFYLREYAKQGTFVSVVRIAVNNLAGVPSIVFGVFGLGFFVYVVGGSIDRLFFADKLPTPTFGTGGILWAALTLALLTVPVVVVATEEGLAAVPRGVREGAYALGATKLETTWKVVLPAAAPGILTGMILAMARAAGEVAPLMIVGMVKLAPALPVDGQPPFLHLEQGIPNASTLPPGLESRDAAVALANDFKAGETTHPPRTLTVTTTEKG